MRVRVLFADRTAGVRAPWSPWYGLARSVLAFSQLLTLIFNDPKWIFQPLGVPASALGLAWPASWSLFALLGIDAGRWTSVIILLVVVVGWRPRITGVLHWWVAFSFTASAVIVHGGDQVCTVLTLLLIPVTLVDRRKWHWQLSPEPTGETFAAFFARCALVAIQFQVAVIYLAAAAGKFAVSEWINGTAVFYWFRHPIFGLSGWRQDLIDPLLTTSFGVVMVTWGVIAIELMLSAAALGSRRFKRVMFLLGVLFHVGIIVVHGLASFGVAMIGALILYLRAPAVKANEVTSRSVDAPQLETAVCAEAL